MGKIDNRQSLAFSERNQLLQAIPQFHVERILHQRTPIARFESQRNERRVYEDQILCFFGGRYDHQRTLVIRIAAISLASDSSTTIARFRSSKTPTLGTPLPLAGPGKPTWKVWKNYKMDLSTPHMTGQRLHCTMEMTPALPW